ncbi:aminotransferase class V-fold PLP-dependent enzyme [Peribacillus glennii]|uniref:Aminotransferase class V-fold PLP-dependent enzyme n=1 Tax=Peribacillus glennii TaxID=2303991 RepID=A0A372LCV3_9BACI|nr:aminotransferase class V-fold PLP-dependent enzyme [Peribacillus glennii]RFU63508.1 aminotransferase class V-fold PLP-dependent enzyme [Peribacillus glennii]
MDSVQLIYKIASDLDELEQIYKLNYKTFVEEIPQHTGNGQLRLVDRFDGENTYIIAKKQSEVVGMISVRANRPFSLDGKISNLDEILPEGAVPCEIRLLSVKEEYRKSYVFYKMVHLLAAHCLDKNYNTAVISGTERQLRLYKKIGFEPFGQMVGNEGARFQPMFLTKERFENSTKAFKRVMHRKARDKMMNFLPGPVPLHKEVEQAFAHSPVSHRSQTFLNALQEVRLKLCQYVNANFAQVVTGTGTLGNDIIAAQLTRIPGRGLLLANGEFGYRLIDHASRFNLDFGTIEKGWREPVTPEDVESYLCNNQGIKWLWTVHCETSTGFLYDLPGILSVCKKHGVELCVDACSSIGVIPVDLDGIYLASSTSGKGLGSYPGLAIVFHRDEIRPYGALPAYLDLGSYHAAGSAPFTHSSNLVNALKAALSLRETFVRTSGGRIREYFKEKGFDVIGDHSYSPGVVTICLPSGISSNELGDRLKKQKILVSYESGYLLKRNWIQVAFMGEQVFDDLPLLVAILKKEADTLIKDRPSAL